MAFIEKKDPVVLNIMLTSKGREQLSAGALTFSYFAVGDSEIDYNFIREISGQTNPSYNQFDSRILKPRDKNPNIISFIPRNVSGGTSSGSPYNQLSTISPLSYDVVNTQNTLGFFTGDATTFITDANHVKQPDVMIYMSGITGGTLLNLRKAPAYGTSGLEPAVGDLLYVKWTYSADTTGYTINKTSPTPYLMYRINAISGGTLGANNLQVIVDRALPNFGGYTPTGKAGALVYYSSITTIHEFATDYLMESVLDFIQNYQCGIENFPYWNMSIIFTEEIAGIQDVDRKFGQFDTRIYGGFVSYIQNQAPIYKKLGVIHYTNNSPANTYGEEFQLNTPVLDIPTIMWHKTTGSTLGTTLRAIGLKKLLTGTTKSLNTDYYDLADPMGNIVGKVFNGLKLFVIEDQELLFAMSYKSNRSWTLPNYIIGSGGSPCGDLIPVDDTPPTPQNIIDFGYAYNFYAAINPKIGMGNFCVPTSAEWVKLGLSMSGYTAPNVPFHPPVGGSETISYVGVPMKSAGTCDVGTGLWKTSLASNIGTNASGFNVKPSGFVDSNGSTGGTYQNADFWTKDSIGATTCGVYWNFSYNTDEMYRCTALYPKNYGFSLRLIQMTGGTCATCYSDYEQNNYSVGAMPDGRTWLTENLRTQYYNDGTQIPSLTGTSWQNTTCGALFTCTG
jgi:uncharacterized protein (TIGR02145 family)